MSSRNGKDRFEPGALTAQVATTRRLASAIVGAFEACAIAGVPLTQIQKVALVEAALLEFDGFEADLRSLERVGETLRRLNGESLTS